jgi:hypothetical protein
MHCTLTRGFVELASIVWFCISAITAIVLMLAAALGDSEAQRVFLFKLVLVPCACVVLSLLLGLFLAPRLKEAYCVPAADETPLLKQRH